MNVSPQFMGEEILKRFHVMPLVMLTHFGAYFLSLSLSVFS
jgi:hypothetical protein